MRLILVALLVFRLVSSITATEPGNEPSAALFQIDESVTVYPTLLHNRAIEQVALRPGASEQR